MDIWLILELPFLIFKWSLIIGFWYMIIYLAYDWIKNFWN